MPITLEKYLETRQEKKVGCVNISKRSDRYFEDSFYTYLEERLDECFNEEMKTIQYIPEIGGTVAYFSLYFDPTMNTYVRVRSKVLCDTLLNEDEVEYVVLQNFDYDMFSINTKKINRPECYIPNRMLLVHEKIMSKIAVFRVYIINMFIDDDDQFKIDAGEFYNSVMIK